MRVGGNALDLGATLDGIAAAALTSLAPKPGSPSPAGAVFASIG